MAGTKQTKNRRFTREISRALTDLMFLDNPGRDARLGELLGDPDAVGRTVSIHSMSCDMDDAGCDCQPVYLKIGARA